MKEYKRKHRWTKHQEEFLRENFEVLTDEKIAEVLGRTTKSIRLKRLRMGKTKASGRSLCISKENYSRLKVK